MPTSNLPTVCYTGSSHNLTWQGIHFANEIAFNAFVSTQVASRLKDEEGNKEFEAHLRGLASTGFASGNLDKILDAQLPETRDWAVGEAIAEAYLQQHHNVTWPWNTERDKRIASASLPGADLIGFEKTDKDVRLVLGEVKSSTDPNTPPGVVYGKSGIAQQLENLLQNLSTICQLLKWLLPRCKGTQHEALFNAAIGLFLKSGNKAMTLFGVLIRDTTPNSLDLNSRAAAIATHVTTPTACRLIAIYLPCKISDLPQKIPGARN